VNQPRFDHDPITKESLGIRIESGATNIYDRGDIISNFAIANSGIAEYRLGYDGASNQRYNSIAPDGSTNTLSLVENTTNTWHRIVYNFTTPTSGIMHTISVYAKSSNRQLVINSHTGFGSYAKFNLSTGECSVVAGGAYDRCSMVDVGNGWWRCISTGPSDIATDGSVFLHMQDSASVVTYTGDGFSRMDLWGLQIEENSHASSYISSGTGVGSSFSTTRSKDELIYRADSGPDDDPLYLNKMIPQGEGTFYGDFKIDYVQNTFPRILNGGNFLLAFVATPQGASVLESTDYSYFQAYEPYTATVGNANAAGNVVIGSDNKIAASYNDSTWSFARNGTSETNVTISPSTNFELSTSNIGIGGTPGADGRTLNGTIKKIAVWNEKFSASQLKALTEAS
jgi:hypothetical protein